MLLSWQMANTVKLTLKHVRGYPERVLVATRCGAKITTDPDFSNPVKTTQLTSISSFAAQYFEKAARNRRNFPVQQKRVISKVPIKTAATYPNIVPQNNIFSNRDFI